jgi:hypothetical protein
MTEFDGKSGSCGYESVECHFLKVVYGAGRILVEMID